MVITPPCDAITPQSSVVVVSGGDAILIKHKRKAGEKNSKFECHVEELFRLVKAGIMSTWLG